MAINRHAHTYVRAYAPRSRRLFEIRRLLALQPNLPPAYKRSRRLFEGGFYSRKYSICIEHDSTYVYLLSFLNAKIVHAKLDLFEIAKFLYTQLIVDLRDYC